MRAAAAVLAALVGGVSGLVGCGPTRPNTVADLPAFRDLPRRPADADPPPPAGIAPSVRTALDPEAPRRLISLAECIALALENGRTQENIRVLAYTPMEAEAAVEQALSRFDGRLQTSMTWNTVDEPNVIPSQALEALRQGIPPVNREDQAQFQSQLLKPLATGGLAGITFTVPYLLTNNPFALTQLTRPAYTPSLQFSFEQPLLRGFGVGTNRLSAGHPGGVMTPFAPSGSGVGILVARLAVDQSLAQFERQVQDLVLEVERAYWDLSFSHQSLAVREEAVRISEEVWRKGERLVEARQMTVQDLAQLETQYHANRLHRLQARGQGAGRPGVLRAERTLRQAVGLPPEDGTQLVPSDRPTDAPYLPDWPSAAAEALALRPELTLARQQVKAAQYGLRQWENARLPDLRFLSTYNSNGIGTRLDGPTDANALRSLVSGRYHDWTMGAMLQVPLGSRAADAAGRDARIRLGRSLAALRDGERAVVFGLQDGYRQLIEVLEALQIQRAILAAAGRQLEARRKEFELGQAQVLNLMNAQQTWVGAREQYQATVCAYNVALAAWQRQKGTILQYDNVRITDGGTLPPVADGRASRYIRERQAAPAPPDRPAGEPAAADRPAETVPPPPADSRPPDPPVLPFPKGDLPSPSPGP